MSVNCSHVCIIYVKIYEKTSRGGLDVSFSIVIIASLDSKQMGHTRFASFGIKLYLAPL